MTKQKISLYDTTLRDGSQGEDISFTLEDKLLIAQKLDSFGIDYIEAGWPGSNPKDLEFFKQIKKLKLNHSKIVAFASTHKAKLKPEDDPSFKALIDAKTEAVTLFGKTWDLHVRDALKISLDKNLKIIDSSIRFFRKKRKEVLYDAEHFFDGYKANPDYALKSILAAAEAGASYIVLCETNGGALPFELTEIIHEVKKHISLPIGIHCHNDGELAVANTLSAVRAGASQVQGTINGYGERCGNANLISIIPNLQLKMGYLCTGKKEMKKLTELSRYVAEISNMRHPKASAFVGKSAFAHKGGVHVSAVMKNPVTYEHIEPELVGNSRRVLVSDLSGASNILFKAKELGYQLDQNDPRLKILLEQIKSLENEGFQFEGAEASFELLLKNALGKKPAYFSQVDFKVTDEKGHDQDLAQSAAEVTLKVGHLKELALSEGEGPVNALDKALRKALIRFYPSIADVQLLDYKVRVLSSGTGTNSKVRVLMESSDGQSKWSTVGVSENIIQASWRSLIDSLEYKLIKDKVKALK